MNSSVFLTALVGLLVVLSGCSGGVTDGTTTGTATGDDTTATATPMGDPYTQSGDELTAQTLASDHEAGLRAAGSFTNQLDIVLETSNGTLDLQTTTEADVDTGVALQTNRIVFEGFVIESTVYTAGNDSFERAYFESNDSEFTEYRRGSEPYDDPEGVEPVNVTDALQGDLITDAVDGADWTQVGVETYDGVSVTRYEAKGIDSFRDLRDDIDPATNTTFTNAEATLFVDSDGIVRFMEITLEIEDDEGSGKIVVTSVMSAIGSTTVAEPDWLERAKTN